MMKKTVLTVLAALLAFCACQKVTPSPTEECNTYALSQLRFDFTIQRGDETKGVRTGWLDGDKVFIFFENISSAYVTVTYNGAGAAWSAVPELPAGMDEPDLGSHGSLTAVYLPYGNTLEPHWDGTNGVWAFDGTNDFYYLKCEKTAYFITDTEDVLPTLGAYIYMDTADNFVQFFLPDDSAQGNIQLACNALIPAGLSGVSLDGTVTETIGTPGGWVTARTDLIDGEKGYYASGKLAHRPGTQYYFAMYANGSYKHYYKQRNSVISARGSYQLPAKDAWFSVSSSDFVDVAGNSWCAVNLGAENPWVSGTSKTPAEISSISVENTLVPSDEEWTLLLDRTKTAWIQLSILGQDGFLIVDREDSDHYFFLPAINYWSTSKTSDIQHYLKTDANGTHEIEKTLSLGTAYIRLISSLYGGQINPPEDGGYI